MICELALFLVIKFMILLVPFISICFSFVSVFTMGELKLTGNCLKGSRPVLSFDELFDTNPQYALLKELFIQVIIVFFLFF